MGIQLSGEFIGFTLGGVKSSSLGIIRTSDGSRYSESLLPTIQDKTIQIPGRDGNYFFGSTYNQKPITIQIAFDSMTREQMQKLKQLCGCKTLQKLIFDETPDRFYWVKSTGTPSLKYIAFDDEDGLDYIYKGEGTLSFIAYDPYAYSVQEFTETFTYLGGLKETGKAYYYYNNGDVETDWRLIIKKTSDWTEKSSIGLTLWFDGVKELTLGPFTPHTKDKTIEINSKTETVLGTTTGTLYNKYLDGRFPKLHTGKNKFGYSNNVSGTQYLRFELESFHYYFKYF